MAGQPHEQAVKTLPFRMTHSEQRIVAELLATGEARHAGFSLEVCSAQYLQNKLITDAAEMIECLQHELFPHEMQLKRLRSEKLETLNGGAMRAHFDQTLETAQIAIQARIRNAAEYADMVQRLTSFDFKAWLEYCEAERIDAD